MTLFEILMLMAAGVVGGSVNAIAGGGTFFTFPVLIAAGLDPLTANASNAVAIFPGSAAAVPAYKEELRRAENLVQRGVIAAFGALLGAGMLLWAGGAAFAKLVPFLIFTATLLFAFGPAIRGLAEKAKSHSPFFNGAIEFLFAVYGGYFGAGLGILLMASLTIVGVRDIQMANAQKNLISTIISTISVSIFIFAGVIAWPQTLSVLVGAIFGGYMGARVARKVPAKVLRAVVISIGLGLSVFYFMKL